jgi:hypothetical protein
MKTLRSWLLCVGVGLLAACNVPAEFYEEGASLATQEFAGELEPGEKSQGRELHGMPSQTDVVRVSFSGAVLGTQPLYNLRLEKGELVAEVPLYPSGTTPSLAACPAITQGQARSCGFVSKGAGSCVPGAVVTLGGGACGTGACTGDAVLRVCSGVQPCEYGSATMIAAGDNACGTTCPQVSFTCPATGTYNVLAGPYNTSQGWSISLAPSSGLLGWDTLRGNRLQGARLNGFTSANASVPLFLERIASAAALDAPSQPYVSDSSVDTWLYKLQYRSPVTGTMEDLCAPTATTPNTTAFALPVSGLYTSTGARQESTTDFTFSCDSGVISKCYRWGYQPWRNGDTVQSHNAHWACTRMARADYCGDGKPHTVNGTVVLPWDALNPQVIAHPAVVINPDLEFEAGWSTQGARCLSHWRWASLTAPSCQTLTPPIPGPDGTIRNRCAPGQRVLPDGSPCANLCDSESEALQVFGSRMYNRSFRNGTDD